MGINGPLIFRLAIIVYPYSCRAQLYMLTLIFLFVSRSSLGYLTLIGRWSFVSFHQPFGFAHFFLQKFHAFLQLLLDWQHVLDADIIIRCDTHWCLCRTAHTLLYRLTYIEQRFVNGLAFGNNLNVVPPRN